VEEEDELEEEEDVDELEEEEDEDEDELRLCLLWRRLSLLPFLSFFLVDGPERR